jgi:uncharacterized membrane protein YhaH (DUF805 family)
MNLAKRSAALLLDPRGRISRQDLLVAATFMLTIDLGLGSLTGGYALYALKTVAYWIGGVGIIKRLHDVGRTGWWLLWGASGMCIWAAILGFGLALIGGFEALLPGSPGYIVLLAALMIPAIGMTLWLHLTPGELEMNCYGASPMGIFGPTAGEVLGTANSR